MAATQLMVVSETPGECELMDETCSFRVGLFTDAERAYAITNGELIDGDEEAYGGGFFSNLKSWVGKHAGSIRKATRIAARIGTPLAMALGRPKIAQGLQKLAATTRSVLPPTQEEKDRAARKRNRQAAAAGKPLAITGGGFVGGGYVGGGYVGGRLGYHGVAQGGHRRGGVRAMAMGRR